MLNLQLEVCVRFRLLLTLPSLVPLFSIKLPVTPRSRFSPKCTKAVVCTDALVQVACIRHVSASVLHTTSII